MIYKFINVNINVNIVLQTIYTFENDMLMLALYTTIYILLYIVVYI